MSNYIEYRQQQDSTDLETVLKEYNLEFIDSTISVFSSDLIRCNAVGELENSQESGAKYYMGIDSASVGKD